MRVLVVDGDLRDSGICEILSLKNPRLRKSANWENDSLFDITHVDDLGFDLLRFDCAPKHFQKILRTSYLQRMIEDLRGQYDLILIDTPPCGLISDAAVFAGVSDAILYVVRQDHVMTMSIRSGINTLLATDVRLLGCVLNGVTSGIGSYGYNYGYGYGYYGYKNYRYGGYGYGESKKRHSGKKVTHEKTK
jgi:Mrp family chromosome partitioning ATPase